PALLSPAATAAERIHSPPHSAGHSAANVENAGDPGRVGALSPVSAGLSVEGSCIFDKAGRADADGRVQRRRGSAAYVLGVRLASGERMPGPAAALLRPVSRRASGASESS